MTPRRLGLGVMAVLVATWSWSAFALLRSDEDTHGNLEATPKELVVLHAMEGPPEAVKLTLHNAGRRPVRILAAESTCGCTVPELPKQVVIAPGDEFVMTVDGTPPGIGEKRATLTIRTDSDDQPTLRVPVLLKGKPLEVPYVTAMPERLDLRTTRDERLSHEFIVHTVEAPDAKPWLETPTADLPDYAVARLDLTEQPGPAGSTQRSYRFRITGPEPPTDGAEQTFQLRFATTTAQSEPRSVRVTYRLVPAVRAVPDELFFRLDESQPGPVEKPVLFMTEDGQALSLRVQSPEVDWLHVDPIKPQAGNTLAGRTTVRIDPAHLPQGTTDATILFHTDHPDCPTVPVRVHVLKSVSP